MNIISQLRARISKKARRIQLAERAENLSKSFDNEMADYTFNSIGNNTNVALVGLPNEQEAHSK